MKNSALTLATSIDRWCGRACAVLLALIVLDVWAGVAARYLFGHALSFTEELARYLMIWMALLAVPCGIRRREHIGLEALFVKLPLHFRRMVLLLIDGGGMLFFGILLWWGIPMITAGLHQQSTLFGISMALPFAAVSVTSILALIQLALMAWHDFHHTAKPPAVEAAAL